MTKKPTKNTLYNEVRVCKNGVVRELHAIRSSLQKLNKQLDLKWKINETLKNESNFVPKS